MITEISLDTARKLLDFGGGHAQNGSPAWEVQLKGAVALHNILAREKVGYLADEVGMGKTYVALGVVSLFRHFNPGWRVLYIVPTASLQKKWNKELLNFTQQKWLVSDNRVQTIQQTPAYDLVICESLLDLVQHVAIAPERDFMLRLSSFSLGLKDEVSEWTTKRDALREAIPWLPREAFSAQNKDEFKRNYARAVNAILPHFDLVVIDEGHNLKHGAEGYAARNQVLANVLGHRKGREGLNRAFFPTYGPRCERALMLSATPLESDYRELWNQLDLVGRGDKWKVLNAPECNEQVKQEAASCILVRRLTSLHIGGTRHTKNQYRREWRNGGVTTYDEKMEMKDDRQKLIVALIQNKVAQIVGDHFNHAFQIGMLASFESFAETAGKVLTEEGPTQVFDDLEQTKAEAERQGVDTTSVNVLARSYRSKFGQVLPHPKMDQVADSLKTCFETGEKTLIFVRRVRSVDELGDKLNRYYDDWIKRRMQAALPPELHDHLQKIWNEYQDERARRGIVRAVSPEAKRLDERDAGGTENFFAWFFRGENAPERWLSGAALVRNRLGSESSVYSTFFEDNEVASLLGDTNEVLERLAEHTGRTLEDTESEMRRRGYAIFAAGSKSGDWPRKKIFAAYQQAALELLAEQAHDVELKRHAQIILNERFPAAPQRRSGVMPARHSPREYLGTRTFFTELALRPELEAKLCPAEHLGDFRESYRRQVQRHEVLSAAARLGHALIDLWTCAVLQLGTLEAGRRDPSRDAHALIAAYLDALEKQSTTGEFGAFCELSLIATNFDLVLDVVLSDVRRASLVELPRLVGRLLARQSPVAGMYATVNQTARQQFCMPGYPLVLVTTDLLQEGVDLHPFCRRVMHYGIAWTPSSMEQRTGRIDRIGSLVQRDLDYQPQAPDERKLQVFYPHLPQTVEVVQVRRVYERMNRFIRMLHRSLAAEGFANASTIDLLREVVAPPDDIAPIIGRLETLFDVKDEWLQGTAALDSTIAQQGARLLEHFKQQVGCLEQMYQITRQPLDHDYAFHGTAYVLPGGKLARHAADGVFPSDGKRQQPFALFLRAGLGDGRLFLRCVSPVGIVPQNDAEWIETIGDLQTRLKRAKLCAVPDSKNNTYNVTVEADVWFDPTTTQTPEVLDLVQRVLVSADEMERQLFNGDDKGFDQFTPQLSEEYKRA